MTEPIVWAGLVCGGGVAAVRGTGAVELWQLSGSERVAVISPPEMGAISAPGLVTCATAVDNKWLLLGGSLPALMLCDVSSRHSQSVPLPSGLPPHIVALSTSPDVLRRNGKVVLLLDGVGAVHVLSMPAFELVRTLQSPKLRIKGLSVSMSGELVALTYSNKATKLYPVSCLQPPSSRASTEALSKQHTIKNTTLAPPRRREGVPGQNRDGRARSKLPVSSELIHLRDGTGGGILKNNLPGQNSRTDFKENSSKIYSDVNRGSDQNITKRHEFRSDQLLNATPNVVSSNLNQLNIDRASSSCFSQSNNKNLSGKSANKHLNDGAELPHDTVGSSRGVTCMESSSNRTKVILRSRTFNTTDGSKLVVVTEPAQEPESSARSGGGNRLIEEATRTRVQFDMEGVSGEEEEPDQQEQEETYQDCINRGHRDKENLKVTAKKVKQTVSHTDWISLLAEFGRFPVGQRGVVWCSLLRLPRGGAIHAALCKKPTHAGVLPYDNMTDHKLRATFRCTLSCLFHWAPSLSNVSWLPSFVFPFSKSLQSSPLLCFEVTVTLIGSWCRLWFISPSSRSPALSAVDAILCDASPRLMARLVAAEVDTDTYAWPLMTSAFAQVLSPEDWLIAWDHLLSQPPSFLLCFTAAFTLCLQPTIAVAETSAQVRLLYGQESFLPVRTVLRRAYNVQRNMRLEDGLLQRLDRVSAFPKGGLPVFDAILDTGDGQQGVEFGLEELDTLMDDELETKKGLYEGVVVLTVLNEAGREGRE